MPVRSCLCTLIAVFASGCGAASQELGIFADEPRSVANGVAVVELFTSQGCNSCPPADAVLQDAVRWARQSNLPIYCLSFHVDYWNQLGWDDPYSDASFTQRQQRYAAAMHERRIYTPQMIVNGSVGFVGSRRPDAERAIQQALRQPAATPIAIEPRVAGEPGRIRVHYTIKGDVDKSVLNIAAVEEQRSNDVPRGENAGKNLQHANVVRAFKAVPLKRTTSGQINLEIPAEVATGKASVIAYVQHQATMRITGAASARIEKPSSE